MSQVVPPHPLATVRAAVGAATVRYLRTVDGLANAQYAEPSVLPGWTRGHVVAHVALNALGLARALVAAGRGEDVPIYASAAARDVEIEERAGLPPGELRELTLGSCTLLSEAMDALPADAAEAGVRRTPDTSPAPAADWVEARWREVEIHHADLAVGYTAADWPEAFLDRVFATVVADRRGGPPMTLATPDGPVRVGRGDGPVVGGSRTDLAWWLLGRGHGEGLTCAGELPTLGPWQRRRTPGR